MNVSNPSKYTIPTRGPIRFPLPHGSGLAIGFIVGLLMWLAGTWLYFTLAPLVRECLS